MEKRIKTKLYKIGGYMTSCKICNRKLEDNKFYKSNKSKCKDCIKAIRIEQIVTNKTWNHI